jgi:small GTP-binding protein
MALFNYASKEITLKVVYYGPGLSGKTTNLKYMHETMSPDRKGKLLSLSTEADRTLFFDFMPIALGKIKDFNIRFQLYTVPGQVRYNATRKLVLKGADAIVFVADSQQAMKAQNIESLENMRENLIANSINPDDIPVLIQFNKQDLNNILSDEELNADLNPEGRHPTSKSAAVDGTGVMEAFKLITNMLLKHISRKHNIQIEAPEESAAQMDASVSASANAEEKKEVALVSSIDNSKSFTEEIDVQSASQEEDLESLLEMSFDDEPEIADLPPPEPVHQAETSTEDDTLQWDTLLDDSAMADSFAEAPAMADSFAEAPAMADSFAEAPAVADSFAEAPAVADSFAEAPAAAGPSAVDTAGISALSRKLDELTEKVASDTGAITRALSDVSSGLKDTSALSNLTTSLNSMNNTLSQLAKEIQEDRNQQAEILNTAKTNEKILKTVAKVILEAAKDKKGGKLFGR